MSDTEVSVPLVGKSVVIWLVISVEVSKVDGATEDVCVSESDVDDSKEDVSICVTDVSGVVNVSNDVG